MTSLSQDNLLKEPCKYLKILLLRPKSERTGYNGTLGSGKQGFVYMTLQQGYAECCMLWNHGLRIDLIDSCQTFKNYGVFLIL